MSRKIKIDEDEIKMLMGNFESLLRTQTFRDGKVDYQFKFKDTDESATLFFTCEAWFKMQSLVKDFNGEVQWSGIVERVDDFTWIITDIMVFPHEVTSTTVTSDQRKYEEWIDALDDNTFNHLRFHGHSHVNMGVFPSGLDLQVRQNVISQITPTDNEAYYIFMILNKKDEWSAEIYDIKNNLLFGKADIEVKVLINDNLMLDAFLASAHELAVEPPKPVVVNDGKKKHKKDNCNYYGGNNYPIGFNDSRDYDDDDSLFGYKDKDWR